MSSAMRDELASVVYPVLSHGVRLKERLDRGDELVFEDEQTTLKKLLKSPSESRKWADYGGQEFSEADLGRAGGTANIFLGCRYALVCWLDEIFIGDKPGETPWSDRWREQSLEAALYFNMRDRAYLFWEQVRLAESRQETDALEVFYLCVVLGFRGELHDNADKLRTWRDAAEGQISRGQPGKWPAPQELQPTTNVPPLRGRERLRRVMMAAGVLLGLLVPAAAFFVVNQLGK
jgi:type VI secretion system protein ImpK